MPSIISTTEVHEALESNGQLNLVSHTEQATVVTESTVPAIIVTGMMGPPGTNKLSTAPDIDTTNLEEGSLLIYRTSTQKWTSSRELNRQVLDAGEF